MKQTLRKSLGLECRGSIHANLSAAELFEMAIVRGEGKLTSSGALAVTTGKHTGRSAADKFIVRDANTEGAVWWDNNKAMDPADFAVLKSDFAAWPGDRDLFVQDLYAGADRRHGLKVRVVTELAWHALFIRHLLRRPSADELTAFEPDLHIVNFPGFKADPTRHNCRSETIIACDFTEKVVLIADTEYAGETKKSVFTTLNYLLPEAGILPMHCSANTDENNNTALFFGLSGTGKTTLSSDASRILVGDDEHAWSPDGIFNFEGGCYAKTINLSPEAEPEIFATTQRWGSVLENVVVDDETRIPDFDDASLTENGRVAYPMDYIANASPTGKAGHPANVIMLTADASGVMPPIARLSPAQAMYHFLSGYTAKVAGTEKGVAGTQATFSTCFGAPFMPRHPSVYGNLLRDLLARHGATCWLVNTGWTGGPYGVGRRMPIKATRTLVSAALAGELASAAMRRDDIFGFEVPIAVAGVDDAILTPRATWADPAAYDAAAARLAAMFADNFAAFAPHVDDEVNAAGPRIAETT